MSKMITNFAQHLIFSQLTIGRYLVGDLFFGIGHCRDNSRTFHFGLLLVWLVNGFSHLQRYLEQAFFTNYLTIWAGLCYVCLAWAKSHAGFSDSIYREDTPPPHHLGGFFVSDTWRLPLGGPCGEPSGSPVPSSRFANPHGSALFPFSDGWAGIFSSFLSGEMS